MVQLTLMVFGAVTWLLSLLTTKGIRRVAPALSALARVAIPRNQRVLHRNLELAYPERSEDERAELARECNFHYACGILEAGMLWHWPVERIVEKFEPPVGLEHLDEALASGRGVVVAAPHFGSWELLSLYITATYDATILYRGGKFPELEKRLAEKRMRAGARLVPVGVSGLKTLYGTLREGRLVAVLPDQDPRRGQGRFVPFFGISALTGVLVPRMLQKTGARLVFLVCERRPGGRYRVRALEPEDGIYSEDVDTALAAMNRGVEACVNLDPGQYLWAYKRYRVRPPGEPSLYD